MPGHCAPAFNFIIHPVIYHRVSLKAFFSSYMTRNMKDYWDSRITFRV